jgi:hypothetical protein
LAETEAEAVAAEESVETLSAELQTEEEQSGTIEDAGSPTHKPSEGSAPEGTGLEQGTPEGSGQ